MACSSSEKISRALSAFLGSHPSLFDTATRAVGHPFGMTSAAQDLDSVESAAIAAATAALDSYAFHLVPEAGDKVRGGGGGMAPDDNDLRPSFRAAQNIVLLAHSTTTFRRTARDVPNKNEVCVDVGSAHGDATRRMADAVGCSENVLGIDVSSEFVRLASAKYPNLKFERLDVLEDTTFFSEKLKIMKPNVVFVDIGGVRASEALVRVLPAIVNACAPRVLSVKCEALALSAKENLNAGVKPTPTLKSDENPNPLPSNFWASVCTLEVTNARKRSVFKSISAEVPANANFSRYALKLPQKFTDDEVEICRFHNYAQAGCLRMQQGRCDLDHAHCHWCLEKGHVASNCSRAASAATESKNSIPGLSPAAAPVRDPNDGTKHDLIGTIDTHDVDHSSFIYVVGGRNRGQTVGVVERLDLSSLTWQRGPRLDEPRGSHGVAAAGNYLFAAAGGGVRSNLHSCEVLRVVCGGDAEESVVKPFETSTTSSWSPCGFVAEARHAVAACATGEWGVYLIGGWGNGNACTGAVDVLRLEGDDESSRVDTPGMATVQLNGGRGWTPGTSETKKLWRSLSPLRTPRKLHAAVGLHDGRVFVFGGRTSDGPNVGPTSSAEGYDPKRNMWRVIRSLPAGGACACACADEATQQVFVLTWGSSGGEGTKAADKATSSTNRLDKRAKKVGDSVRKAAIERGLCEADAVLEGKAARSKAFAEFQKQANESSSVSERGGLWRYDPDCDTYQFITNLPLPEWYGFTAVACGGWVYAIGGSTSGKWTGAAFRFQSGAFLSTKNEKKPSLTWETLPAMEMVRRRTAAAVVRVRK